MSADDKNNALKWYAHKRIPAYEEEDGSIYVVLISDRGNGFHTQITSKEVERRAELWRSR